MLKKTKKMDLQNRLLEVLEIRDIRDSLEAFEIIVTSLATICKSTGIMDIKTLAKFTNFTPLKSLESLSTKEISIFENFVQHKMETLTSQDIYESQISVARLIAPTQRKKLAAYYTKPVGLKLMGHMASKLVKTLNRPLILSDPFLGSGLTLSETARIISPSNIDKIWGIEPHPLSALVAYAAITRSLRGKYQKVEITVGDTFQIVYGESTRLTRFIDKSQDIIPKADAILTNPPFTRWELLDKDYRIFLTKLVHAIGYHKYVKRKQQNLQLISLFIMDYFLKRNGLLISVLPASTFYTLYGEAAKDMLRDKYYVHAVVDFSSAPSFSIDSGFKEVILIASKRKVEAETAFLTIEPNNTEQLERLSNILKGIKLSDKCINWVNISKIPYPWNMNWLALIGHNPLRELISKVFIKAVKSGVVDTWAKVFSEKKIVRGVEMYGPDFFFIPNKYWKIFGKDVENVIIENHMGRKLQISKKFLTPSLRKPELYVDSLIPKVQHYFLLIPPEDESKLPYDIVEYIKWGEAHSTAKPAIRAFGRYWYSHVNRQIKVKKPFGRVFLPDKIDPFFKKRGVFACYSDEPLTASKNFYVVTLNNRLKDKALALWFNTSLFIAYFVIASRKISERWTRFLEEDYLRMPVINVDVLDEQALHELASVFDKIASKKLEPLIFQLGKDYRLEMDETLLEILGIDDPATLRQLYSMLRKFLC